MKGPIIAVLIMIAIIIGYSFITMPQQETEEKAAEPFRFEFSVQEYGLLDSGDGVRGYLTAHAIVSSVNESEIRILMLPDAARREVLVVADYPAEAEKQAIVASARDTLSEYGVNAENILLHEAMERKNAVIILASDAMPDRLSSGEISSLIDGNTVIFFGKPLDLSIDRTGAQAFVEGQAYDALNITVDSRGALSPKVNGPRIYRAGDATVMKYENGWFVVYPEELTGEDMAGLILGEGWQSGSVEDAFMAPAETATRTFYSSLMEEPIQHMRIIYRAETENDSKKGIIDIDGIEKADGRLSIAEKSNSGKSIPYSFELTESGEYTVRYDMKLLFVRDGEAVDNVDARTVMLKNYARESGSINPNITSGAYIVKLVDQNGEVHAAAYTMVPEVKVRLVRIEGNEHIFMIWVDGQPAASTPVLLIANDKKSFQLKTNENGEVGVDFLLAPGMHTFVVEVGGERGVTYYKKADDSSPFIYPAAILGGALVLGAAVLGSKKKRRFMIKTYNRPSLPSRTLRIPYKTFMEIFRKTQDDRAKGMPLSVSDLKIGMRKHATYKGAPLFVTDSNTYGLLDGLAKKGHFLAYGGYFMPADDSDGKPAEYWAVMRRLSDSFVERGITPQNDKGADFIVGGRRVHVWRDIDPKELLDSCKKAGSVIVFPDAKAKVDFGKKLNLHDEHWMMLSLELQYGRLYCQTVDEFLELGLNGKV